ncbi:hypothetical protein GGX14DRAFT_564715 [Mycena pura]|uniref:Uncharacterized protein n=1 Tax=Mycena pura TaxID=153505 RepID=A0AAD6YGG7_9AGAR|nr:hypothetical protein GGX14DRAFT_564715 [Mycena pura]
MPLTGAVLSVDICHPSETRYPRTRVFLQQSAKALADYAISYHLVLLMILQERRNLQISNLPLLRDINHAQIEQKLQSPPHVCLVEELKSPEIGRLWGCVAKDTQDIAVYGQGICLNADMVKVFEREPPGTPLSLICQVLIFATFAHETMHCLHHHFFPHQQFLTTLPTNDARGEMGWELETQLLGGIVGVTWGEVGNFRTIQMLTFRERGLSGPLKQITDDIAEEFLACLTNGVIRRIKPPFAEIPEPVSPLVNSRGPIVRPSSEAETGLQLPDGVLLSFVGSDRWLP